MLKTSSFPILRVTTLCGPYEGKSAFQHAQNVHSDHSAHVQYITRTFALYSYIQYFVITNGSVNGQ